MPRTEVAAYPWPSDSVFAAELDVDGIIQQANAALELATGDELVGLPFRELLAVEQHDSFTGLLSELNTDWRRASFGFYDGRGGLAEDRCLWLRQMGDGRIELIAEPAWKERDRLVEQVLELNDDLISTQRTLARRQRDLQRAQHEAARAAHRVTALEAIVLAGVMPHDFDEALNALLGTAQAILPGDRADILLLDEVGDRLVVRATAGPGAPRALAPAHVGMGEGLLGSVAAEDASRRFEDLRDQPAAVAAGRGSLIATPLRLDGQVVGVLAASAGGAGCFADADLRLLEVVAERVALAVGQAQLRDREHRLEETLQRALLPQQLPDVAGFEFAARYHPLATGVGGDFYDAVELPDGTLGLAIGDVTGKGLRAAAAMGRLRSALHAYALDSSCPAEVLTRLDRLAVADGAMATALYLVLDPVRGQIQLSSAGHLPPLYLEGSHARYVDISPALSPPLGFTVETRRQMTVELAPGAALLLFTDGLVERTHNIDEGLERLVTASAAGRVSAAPLDELCEHLLLTLAPAGRYRDDVALLALRRN